MSSASPDGQAQPGSPDQPIDGDGVVELCLAIGRPSANGTNPVSARMVPVGTAVRGTFRLPFAEHELADARGWMQRGAVEVPQARTFGARLFAALFQGRVKDAYRASLHVGSQPIRYRLCFDDPALQRVPWELLYDRHRSAFLWATGMVVRSTDPVPPRDTLPAVRPLRLLAVGVSADEFGNAHHLKLTDLRSATLDELRRLLPGAGQRRQPQPPDVLHLAVPARRSPVTGHVVLLLSTRDDGMAELDAARLGAVLALGGPRLVVFDLPAPAEIAPLDVLAEFTPTLIAKGVQVVLAMHRPVTPATNTTALEHFYAAVAAGCPVDAAAADAQARIATVPGGGLPLGIPVCYLQSATGRLVTPAAPVTTPTARRHPSRPRFRWRLSPRRIAAALSALLGLVATLTGLYAFYTDRLAPHPTPPMTGDLNIAVAQFGQVNLNGHAKPSTDHSGFADSLQDELRQQLGPLAARGFQVQLRSPSQTGQLDGATPEERAKHAERRAQQLNAHILVYGTLDDSENATSVAPEFYIAPGGMRNAEELIGHFAFGSPISVAGDAASDAVAHRDLRRHAVARARALVQFMLGLGSYRANQLNDATAAFAAAEKTGGWGAHDGEEVLYLFAGNTAGKLGHYDIAKRAYTLALKLNPNYARAQLGLGEIHLHQAARGCTPGQANLPGLRRSVAMFEKAQIAADQPPLSDVPTKAAFQLGRAYSCLSQAGGGEQLKTAAKEEFDLVVREFDQGNGRIRHLAAESHFGLALIATPSPGDPTAKSELEQVAVEYEKAIALSGDDPGRQQIFYQHLSETYQALGRAADAQQAREHTGVS